MEGRDVNFYKYKKKINGFSNLLKRMRDEFVS